MPKITKRLLRKKKNSKNILFLKWTTLYKTGKPKDLALKDSNILRKQ
jgi:hypothetical protein